MKHFVRVLLLIAALAIGGGLGVILLPGYEPLKILLFALVCIVLGEVFYQIDRQITKK
ncbi:MAG: hypothetical protein J6J43_08375 [Oscillospiraceae bacterium]|nr:hypothetical protein [Oscillospiraceae bacterium]